MGKNDGYYEIELDENGILEGCGAIDGIFHLKELKQRKLFLNGEISQESVCEIVKHILQFNKEDIGIEPQYRKPILLYITSEGGDVDSGFELIDIIQNSKTPVFTVNLGYQYSMGFLIGIAGHTRFATKNAKFLMHDGSSMVYNSGSKMQDQMEFCKKENERIKDYILSAGNLESDTYDSKVRVEWYMYADEAKQNGFVDYIIGEDCDIDTII